MIIEQKATKESELHGRQSGSLAWKLSRGETDEDDVTNGFILKSINKNVNMDRF